MDGLPQIGRILIALGLGFILIGAILNLSHRLPLGRLPGDIHISRDGFHFYFPLTTCLLISAILTLAGWLFFKGPRSR